MRNDNVILSLLKQQRDAIECVIRKHGTMSDSYYNGKIEAYNEAIALIYKTLDESSVVHIKVR